MVDRTRRLRQWRSSLQFRNEAFLHRSDEPILLDSADNIMRWSVEYRAPTHELLEKLERVDVQLTRIYALERG